MPEPTSPEKAEMPGAPPARADSRFQPSALAALKALEARGVEQTPGGLDVRLSDAQKSVLEAQRVLAELQSKAREQLEAVKAGGIELMDAVHGKLTEDPEESKITPPLLKTVEVID